MGQKEHVPDGIYEGQPKSSRKSDAAASGAYWRNLNSSHLAFVVIPAQFSGALYLLQREINTRLKGWQKEGHLFYAPLPAAAALFLHSCFGILLSIKILRCAHTSTWHSIERNFRHRRHSIIYLQKLKLENCKPGECGGCGKEPHRRYAGICRASC